MTRTQLTIFLVVISVIDAIVIGAVVGATTGSAALALTLGLGSVVALWAIVLLIGWGISRVGTWATLRRRYPPVEQPPFGAGSRTISLGLGSRWLRMNNCVEAVADDGHLHMRIAFPGTRDGGPVSIPWEAVRSVEEAPMRQAILDVEGVRLWLPGALVAQELELRRSMAADAPADADAAPGPAREEAIG